MNTYHLTHPQKRIWYNEKLYPQTSLHNIGGLVVIKGTIQLEKLAQAILYFIQANDGVRLQITEQEGEPQQYISHNVPEAIDFFDFSQQDTPHITFRHWAEETFRTPLWSLDQPLFYFATFKVSQQEMGYFVKFHHIICDGWSILLISQQVVNFYEQLLKTPHPTIPPRPSYLTYIEEETNYLASARFLKDKTFWLEQFTTLPTDNTPTTSPTTLSSNRQTYLLDQTTSETVRLLCERFNSSAATLFTTLFLLYYRFYEQTNDVVIGVPVFNRIGRQNRQIFGMFTSTMPLRVTLHEGWTIAQLFNQVNKALRASLTHQRYPYDLLVHDLQLRQQGRPTLYTMCINYYNTQLRNTIDGVPLENEEIHTGCQLYDLQFIIHEWSSHISLSFDYRVTEYASTHIDDLFAILTHLLKQIPSPETITLQQLNPLPPFIQQKLLFDFNPPTTPYPQQATLSDLIEKQAQRTPHNIAVSNGRQHLTYAQLINKANQVAHFLLAKGVRAHQFVGVMAHKDINLLPSIIGILKAGAAYIPLDPQTPLARVQTVLHQASAHFLLSNLALQVADDIETLSLSDPAIAQQASDSLPPISQAHDPVYLIFTSGSTGTPKGIVIEHRHLIHYLWWAKTTYFVGETDIFALHASLAFDLTVTSLFAPLLVGAQIRLYASDEHTYALYKVIQENVATIVKLTPSELSLLSDQDNSQSSIRCFIVGGEDFKTSLAQTITDNFKPQSINIYNEYGPTETVVGCLIHRYDPTQDVEHSVPIGVPISNTAVYILNDSLQPLPPGAVGQLYISGAGVGRGYLHNQALTKARFLDNPFIPGWRMYKSGDLARLTAQNVLMYLGRQDDQVKIHGYRIEPGEITNCLQQLKQVKEALVIIQQSETSDKTLCAYLVTTTPLPEATIRNHLAARLPHYMIPSHLFFLEELPLSASGKVNKKALPKPEVTTAVQPYLAPTTYAAGLLIDVITEVLEGQQIGLNHNFIQLGGDSIKAIRVAAKLQQYNYNLATAHLLSQPTISHMLPHLEAINSQANAPDTSPSTGIMEPTPILVWFTSLNLVAPQQYHQSLLLEVHQPLSNAALTDILHQLRHHHDALRLNYQPDDNTFFYTPLSEVSPIQVSDYNLSNLTLEAAQERLAQVGQQMKTAVNLTHDCLLQAATFQLANGRQLLLLIAHHIIIDGVSWQILLDDLLLLLRQQQNNRPLALPPPTLTYQTWSSLLRQQTIQFEAEQLYWQTIVTHCNQAPILPSHTRTGDSRQQFLHTMPLTSQDLNEANQTYDTKSNELLLAALSLALFRWQQITDIPLLIESHGREATLGNLWRTVGWFTAVYPLYLSFSQDTLKHRINTVKTTLQAVPTGGLGYGVLHHLHHQLPPLTSPLIRFNYLGEWDTALDTTTFSRLDWSTGQMWPPTTNSTPS